MCRNVIKRIIGCLLLFPLISAGAQANAGKGNPVHVRMGYFGLASVKASYPEAVGLELLRASSENQLYKHREEANKRLSEAAKTKSKEELNRLSQDEQSSLVIEQKTLVDLIATQEAQIIKSITAAVQSVAMDRSLDVVFDGAGCFAEGDLAVNNGIDVTADIFRKLRLESSASPDAKPATNVPVSFGYFHFGALRKNWAVWQASERARANAVDMLRRQAEAGGKRLQEGQSTGASRVVLEEEKQEMQWKINSMHQKLIAVVQTQAKKATHDLAEVVGQVAEKEHLDMALDADSIFVGADLVASNGKDVTEEIAQILCPLNMEDIKAACSSSAIGAVNETSTRTMETLSVPSVAATSAPTSRSAGSGRTLKHDLAR